MGGRCKTKIGNSVIVKMKVGEFAGRVAVSGGRDGPSIGSAGLWRLHSSAPRSPPALGMPADQRRVDGCQIRGTRPRLPALRVVGQRTRGCLAFQPRTGPMRCTGEHFCRLLPRRGAAFQNLCGRIVANRVSGLGYDDVYRCVQNARLQERKAFDFAMRGQLCVHSNRGGLHDSD